MIARLFGATSRSSRLTALPGAGPASPARRRNQDSFGSIVVDTDTRIASAVAVLYLVLAAVLLPAGEYPRALGGGVVVFALVAAAAWRLGRGRVRGRSVFAVGVASSAALIVPAMESTRPVAGALAFLGVQAAMLLWAACRWISRPPPDTRASLRSAWKAGVIAAAILCAVAAIPLVLELFLAGAERARVLSFYPGYFAGMLGTATVYWLLQRIAHLAVGRHLIGLLGGACVYGGLAAVRTVSGEPFDLAMTVLAGGLAGPAVAFMLADLPAGRRITETPRGTPAETASP
jgi:hypothetical protein